MPQVINSNISSLNAQRNLNTSQNALSVSLQRLSSGLRINSAKDDAAGLGDLRADDHPDQAASTRPRNANDGISLAQTGEGALAERRQQPAADARTGGPGRQRHQQRHRPRRLAAGSPAAAVQRSPVAGQTAFNGVKLLDGSFNNADLPGRRQRGRNDHTGDTMVTAINLNSGTTGVTATYDSTTARITLNAADGRDITLSQTATDADASSTLIGYGFKATNGTNNTANDALTALTAASGTAVSNVFRGSIRLTSNEAITLSGNNETYIGYADASAMALGASALNSVNVKTVSGANTAIGALDSALTQINSSRGAFGSYQNRFSSAIANLSTTAENISAARSRIQDADFAAETASLTRNQILQQAGTAMLAQANALPQNVLTLIRG
jgi:flagellin